MMIHYDYVQEDRTKVTGSGEDELGKFTIQGEASSDPFEGVENSTLKLVVTYPNKSTRICTGEFLTRRQTITWMTGKQYTANVGQFYGTWHNGIDPTDTRGFEL